MGWSLSVALIYLELTHHWVAISVSMVLTLMLGWASWAYVVQPAGRRLIRFKKLPQIAVTCGVVLLVAVPAAGVRLKEGVSGRLDPKVDAIFAESENKNPRRSECHSKRTTPEDSCIYGGSELGLIVIGDSHAQAVVRSIEKSLPSPKNSVIDWTTPNCPTIHNIKKTGQDSLTCETFIRGALEASKAIDPSVPIIIVNRYSAYISGPNEPGRADEIEIPDRYISKPYGARTNNFFAEMQAGIVETACAFAQQRQVYMLRPIPELLIDVPRTMGRSAAIGQTRRVSISLDEYQERHRIAWMAQDRASGECGVILLDPRPYLCSDGRCWGDADGRPLYYDDDHLSERGGQLLIPLFKQMFNTNDLPQVSQNQ